MSAPTPSRWHRGWAGERYTLAHPRRSEGVAGGLLLIALVLAVVVRNAPSPFRVDLAWANRAAAPRSGGLAVAAQAAAVPMQKGT